MKERTLLRRIKQHEAPIILSPTKHLAGRRVHLFHQERLPLTAKHPRFRDDFRSQTVKGQRLCLGFLFHMGIKMKHLSQMLIQQIDMGNQLAGRLGTIQFQIGAGLHPMAPCQQILLLDPPGHILRGCQKERRIFIWIMKKKFPKRRNQGVHAIRRVHCVCGQSSINLLFLRVGRLAPSQDGTRHQDRKLQTEPYHIRQR